MSSSANVISKHLNFVERQPVVSYFVLTFIISWTGALAVAAPHLVRREPLTQLTGILMFPAMLLGPPLTGILLTRTIDGRNGLRALRSRIFRAGFAARWYAALLIPPALILAVLLFLKTFLSPVYTPNFFLTGIFYGIPAGLLEELGWTGFALPRMAGPRNRLGPSILLGFIWSLWHLPVVNYLGTATPHGSWWPEFFLVFLVAMTAMRVLISWLYVNTGSVLLAQLMHFSSTGSLVVLSASHVHASQEVLWYAFYGAALWIIVGSLCWRYGRSLTRSEV